MKKADGKICAIAGGVGGAKLAKGFADISKPDQLKVIVNTGDDFRHLGLHISPDLDTAMYTLSGLNDQERGWGLAGETWGMMKALKRLGGPDWFLLGDSDLATHLMRSELLANGATLTEVTRALSTKLGVNAQIFPMSDDPVRTMVVTDEGTMGFQEYFVGRQCAPRLKSLTFEGAAKARFSPDACAALQDPDISLIAICPSNPMLSIGPILAIPSARAAIKDAKAPVVAVSPIVGGTAIKGPLAKIMSEQGMEVSALSVAKFYGDLLDGFVLDEIDFAQKSQIEDLGIQVLVSNTVMHDDDAKRLLAQEVLGFGEGLRASR